MKYLNRLCWVLVGSAVLASGQICPTTANTNTDCAYVITIGPGGSLSGAAVPGANPYDGADDSLVGVINDSGKSFTGSFTLTSANRIFGFDGDGICSFTHAAYCSSGSAPTGYEGPLTSFSNYSSGTSGTVNITGLAAGATTYFSLEGPPLALCISVNGGPTGSCGAASNPITRDSPYQVMYASNLQAGDSVINISNSGANGASLYGPGFGAAAGNICVNAYVFSPDEEMVSCCSCLVTPNALVSLSVVNDLISNPLNGIRPTSVVVKLLATLAGPGGSGTSCTNSAAMVSTPVAGMVAWGTTLHAAPSGGYVVTESALTPSTLSADGELPSLTNRCTNIIGNATGAGICAACRVGGLGAVRR